MKTLSQSAFDISSRYILNNARYLEKLVFGHHFISPCPEKIVKAYKMYQNKDGGYGNGLEPDFRLPFSSPMATSVAIARLRAFKDDIRALEQIEKAILYLESTYNDEILGWESTSKMVNLYPHAPWWTYSGTRKGIHGKPSAEILAYLLEFSAFVRNLDLDKLKAHYIQYFNTLESYEEHEVYCFIRLYDSLSDIEQQLLESNLLHAINQLVVLDQKEWHKYVPYPLKFIGLSEKLKIDIPQTTIEDNIDFLVDLVEENGCITPSWGWSDFPEEWEISKREWIGILTLDALLTFKEYGAINREKQSF